MANHLLIIDDEEINNFLIGELLSEVKAIENLEFFTNGWEALDYLGTIKNEGDFPDLIFVDINMPQMDGYEFTERFEHLFYNRYPKTQIVILSNSIRSSDKEKSLNYKAVCQYINKPLDEEKVVQIIDSCSKDKQV